MKPTSLSKYLTQYLSVYLPGVKGLSSHTIASRRDAFMLLFIYLKEVKNLKPESTDMNALTKDTIIDYLDWLERERKCSVATRNLRHAAMKSFFSYVQVQTPDFMYQCQQVLSIPRKKAREDGGLKYLTLDAIKAILDSIDATTKSGLRDLTILSVLYDSAARVHELTNLQLRDFRFEKPATLRLTGKGSKSRIIPLMEPTSELALKYLNVFHSRDHNAEDLPFFYNRNKTKLSRAGISYILEKHVNEARNLSPSLIPANVSPHWFRHSKSMHMLQADVPLIYIRDYLGHVEISTTEIYARCDTSKKRQAIESAMPEFRKSERAYWQEDENLLSWLKSLC